MDWEPKDKNKAWLKGNTNSLEAELREKGKEEYSARIPCQMSRQAIERLKDLERPKRREETGALEENLDSQNLKNQRGMVG